MYEHGCIGSSGFGHQFVDALHGGGITDESVVSWVERLVQRHSPSVQQFQRSLDRTQQFLVGERFDQILGGACFDSPDGIINRRIAGNEHDLHVRMVAAHVFNQFHAAAAGHLQVSDNQVHGVVADDADRILHATSGQGGVALGIKVALNDFPGQG